MRQFLHRCALLAIALVIAAGPLLATTAEAGRGKHKYRGHRGRGAVHVEKRVVHHDHHVSHGSGVVPFLGGVAVGAIIGGSRYSCPPPPPPPRRVYIYDCDPCGYHGRSYDGWVAHLTVRHDVPRCDIDTYYPPHYGGHWEAW